MNELRTQLGTIFIMQLIVGNFTEVGIPAIRAYWAHSKLLRSVAQSSVAQSSPSANTTEGQKKPEIEMSEVEHSFMQPSYDVMLGPFSDYAELVIQFGYSTMFVAAFPLASLMSFVNNYVEIRVDAWKLCEQCRRPEPRSCEDIGTWYDILEIISYVAVVTNTALVTYTGFVMKEYDWAVRNVIFVGMCSGLFGAKWLLALMIPDMTREVDLQLQRQDFIIDKVIHLYQDDGDDDDDDVVRPLSEPANYCIRGDDDDPM